jgi:peptide/nickel transport system permease protein
MSRSQTLSGQGPVVEASHGAEPAARRDVLGRGWALPAPSLIFSILVLVVVLPATIDPAMFTHFNPVRGVGSARLLPPGPQHVFGTDQMGRDLYARVVYGTRQSIWAVFIAVLLGSFTGCSIGLAAGYLGGWADDILMRLVDVLLAVPMLLISLAIINALGFGMTHIAIAVGVGSVAGFARVMRSEVLKVRQTAYVEAAAFSGIGRTRLILRYILPNTMGSVLALAALELGWAILGVSALSFLGFGPPPPTPEWGLLVAGGRNFMASAWWLIFFPGVVIAVTVLAANRVARALDNNVRAY